MYLKIANVININVKLIKRLTHTNTIANIFQKDSSIMVYSKYPVRTHLSNFISYDIYSTSTVNSYRLSHGHPVVILRYLQGGFFKYEVIGHITNSRTFKSLRDEVIHVKNEIENRIETIVLYKKSFSIEKNDLVNFTFTKILIFVNRIFKMR